MSGEATEGFPSGFLGVRGTGRGGLDGTAMDLLDERQKELVDHLQGSRVRFREAKARQSAWERCRVRTRGASADSTVRR